MSDFLVSIGNKYSRQDLLSLLKQPYGSRAPDGQCFSFPWGSIAVLNERLANNKNIIIKDKTIFAWVGDLVTDISDTFTDALIERLACLKKPGKNSDSSIVTDKVFEKLNGAFAIIVADEFGISVITDPMSFIQIFMGKKSNGQIISIGTHLDLTAKIIDEDNDIDLVSVGEFLESGYCTFPNTTYTNVKEIKPGRAHIYQFVGLNKCTINDFIYWTPPAEIAEDSDYDSLVEELRNALISSVKSRCGGQGTGILLSGGLDSRMIMAAVPKEKNCIGITYCDELNREAKVASRVAEYYNRKWFFLKRDSEYLGNTIVNITKFIGCDFDWVDAHAFGFCDDIHSLGVDTILNGTLFDMYLKGIYTYDWAKTINVGGIFPPTYKKNRYEHNYEISGIWQLELKNDIIEQIQNRRQNNYRDNFDSSRSSTAEWLKLYPFSNDPMSEWSSERRLLPVRFIAMDRSILNFAFRCPIRHKLGGKIFNMAAKSIYGPGLKIPNANNGVRPGSGHWSRLVQRVIRKFQDRTTKTLEVLGIKPKIEHSWHDYQNYWQESKKLDELIQEYGHNLDHFDGVFFKKRGLDLLQNKDLYWQSGFRLLQLAIWMGIKKNYGKL